MQVIMGDLMKSLRQHLEIAKVISTKSKCNRLKVGAVLVRDDRIVCSGYNGDVVGGDNQCEDEDGNTKPTTIHAEYNCIAFAARYGIKTEGCSLVMTHSPCVDCSRLILQSGIKEVYYQDEYRLKEGIDFLSKYIGVYKHEE